MLRRRCRLFGLLPAVILAAVHLYPSSASAQKLQELAAFAPPTLSLTSDAAEVSTCATSNLPGPQVRLNARASLPAGYQPAYRWSTTAGHIIGNGSMVTWDLSGVRPGYYKALVEVQTAGNGGECQAFTSTRILVNSCPPAPPVCPKVSIVCPESVVADQPLTFGSSVSNAASDVTPMYTWTVSAGRIIKGQGTESIRVDTTGLGGQTVRATLSLSGYTLECADACAIQIPLPELHSRKFDEFPDIARNDEKARLDNFAVELQTDPTASAYVIIHPGRTGRPDEVQRHMTRIVDYLVNSRRIDAKRIFTLVGGTREKLVAELWISPQGAPPPKP